MAFYEQGRNYVTSPPSEIASDLADFHQRQGHAPRFAGKGQGNCTLVDAGRTIRRSSSRTAAGKLAGGGRAKPTPTGGAMTPPSKTRTPPPVPLGFSSKSAPLTCIEPCIFRPRFSGR